MLAGLSGCLWDGSTNPSVNEATSPVYLIGGRGDAHSISGFDISVGESVAFAGTVVRNRGDKVAEMLTAHLVAKTPPQGAALTDVRIFDFKRVGLHPTVADRWPSQNVPAADTVPLPGYRLLPKSEVALVFIVHADRKGQWDWKKTRATFRYDGHTYTDTVNNGSTVCAGVKTSTRATRPHVDRPTAQRQAGMSPNTAKLRVLVACLIAAGCHGFPSRQAPVSLLGGADGDVGNTTGMSISVGQSVVFASTIMRNTSDKAAELLARSLPRRLLRQEPRSPTFASSISSGLGCTRSPTDGSRS